MNVLFLRVDGVSHWALTGSTIQAPDPDRLACGRDVPATGYRCSAQACDPRIPSQNHWRLVRYGKDHPCQPFDLATDPDDTNDLYTSCPEIVTKALCQMEELMGPDVVNWKALAAQRRRTVERDGADATRSTYSFDHAPANSR